MQGVIEAAGYLCIFLLKFYCEFYFVEFVWGTVMYYLCENYDFMFDTFKENLPKALTLVNINITWEWEHQMVQCMNEYCDSYLLETHRRSQFSKMSFTLVCNREYSCKATGLPQFS